MSIRARVASARFFGGSGASAEILQLASRFQFSDSFDRADSPAVGNGWVEELETCEILANLLHLTGGGGGSAFCHRPNAEAVGADVWMQVVYDHSVNTVPPVIGLFNTDPFGGRDGYEFRADAFAADILLERVTGGALTALDTVGVASATGTFYVVQFAVSHDPAGPSSLQEVNWWRQSAPASLRTLTAADGTHTGDKRVALQRGAGTTETADFDDCLICVGSPDPMHISLEGMVPGSGEKLRIFDAGAALVTEAAEVAGVATVDLFGGFGGNGLEWPLVGHPLVVYADAADVELARLEGPDLTNGGVFPGDTFEVAP